MLNCHDATFLISQRQDRSLTLAERLQLRMHIGMCRGCANFEQQVPALRSLAKEFVQGGEHKKSSDS